MWDLVNWSIDMDNKEQTDVFNFKEKYKNRRRVRERGWQTANERGEVKIIHKRENILN